MGTSPDTNKQGFVGLDPRGKRVTFAKGAALLGAEQNSYLVVVGSSAGGIEALSELVSTLPEGLPAPVVIAQHLDPDRESRLQEIRAYLKRNAYDEIQIKLLRGNTYKYWKRGERYNERNPLRNKPLQRILDELSDQNFNEG